ncbi:MAG TPA: PspC domain-containing protein [Acidimicrobiia bacterium]|nr:PspC domain-containing protein [Acidimicrobiia bacterium]
MEQTNTTEAPEAPVVTRELVRPREGRIVAGVAQGFANRYDLPVLLIRAIFVLLTFAGGLGVALYAAGWFLIRSSDETDTPAQRIFSGASTSRSWLGIALVFVAILILLDNFTFLSTGIVWSVGLLVVGVLLYTGDLPRLVRNQGADEQEGVQQMTTTDAPVAAPMAPVEPLAPSGPSDAGGALPPTPTPTPPVLPPPPPKPKETSYLGRITIGVVLVSLGILAILDNIPGVPIEPQPRHYIALATVIIGLGLIVGGFVGRARWLILIGALLVPTLLFSPVFEYNWNSEEFDRTVSPDEFAELEDSYSLDVGNLVIDLTDLPWDGETVDLEARVDAGNIEIWIPLGVGLEGEAMVDIGRVGAFGRETSGLGNPTLQFDRPGPEGTVVLDASVDVGNIDIQVVGR